MKLPSWVSWKSVVVTALIGLACYTTAAAQQGEPSGRFRGPATRLRTTPEALEAAYAVSLRTNPALTHGQFTAANMLARNLRSTHPTITTQAILSGLQGGKSLGQTLQALGLSSDEAKLATKDADHWAKEAIREAKESSRP
jgi:hypothetical protein